jgi:hypothetical protein
VRRRAQGEAAAGCADVATALRLDPGNAYALANRC